MKIKTIVFFSLFASRESIVGLVCCCLFITDGTFQLAEAGL